jgi:hypothetical protein
MSETIEATRSDATLAEWREAVDELLTQLRSWFESAGWSVGHESRDITEDLLGTYRVAGLKVQTPDGVLYVEPVARFVGGAEGRVDLFAFPTLYRVMLLRDGERGWWIRTDSGIPLRQPWVRDTFIQLGRDLLAAG